MGRKSTARKLRRQIERKRDQQKPLAVSVYQLLTGMTEEEFWQGEDELKSTTN